MRLLINEPILLTLNLQGEEWYEFSCILTFFSIRTAVEGRFFILLAQKINLDEIKINEFLSFLDSSEYVLSYGNLGGAGCELSLNMSKPQL
jgi:hypothetical protein